MASRFFTAALVLASSALARTDLEGCTSFDSVVSPDHGPAYATRVFYMPDSGEICSFLDCGGGRAPPKTTVPGCPLYEGTDIYSPDFLDLATVPGATVPPTTVAAETTTAASSQITAAATDDDDESSSSSDESTSRPITVFITEPPAASTGAPQPGSSGSPTDEEAQSEDPPSAAMPTAVAFLGPYLAAGIAVGLGMM